ncbi:hypothetical protein, partial [Nitrobacter vulgaris]|uniref:hypothetical protein n=1 Tax=Nitrobacter vulgaris TaxID=29421 RepID=UPI001AECC668
SQKQSRLIKGLLSETVNHKLSAEGITFMGPDPRRLSSFDFRSTLSLEFTYFAGIQFTCRDAAIARCKSTKIAQLTCSWSIKRRRQLLRIIEGHRSSLRN